MGLLEVPSCVYQVGLLRFLDPPMHEFLQHEEAVKAAKPVLKQ
jgi:hypothetical protein